MKQKNNQLFNDTERTRAHKVQLPMIMHSSPPAAQPFLMAATQKLGAHTHTYTPLSSGRELPFVDNSGLRLGNMSVREMDKK